MSVRILPDNLIDIIAAGEVVERPASVVKELIENALDAGATEIEVDVKDGGRTLIQVSDNGRGMDREDLEKSVLRHATSKLPDNDLLHISFMGFRGEALPSIASVSEMTIETNGLALDALSMKIKPSRREHGTCVRVKNLFQRVPARLKFLRSDRVEMMAVSDVVSRLALARPDVGFSFNDKIRHASSEPLISRFRAIAGGDTDGGMLEVDALDGNVRLHGFVSVPILRRASGINQYLFVNRRPVKDKVLVGALRAAYFDVMHAREFPLCCLYLEMPPHQVDVNVSPAKTEVHFLEPARIRDFIVRTIRRALAATAPPQESPTWGGVSEIADGKPAPYSGAWADSGNAGIPNSAIVVSGLNGAALEFPLGYARAQIGNKYIVAENPEGLIIIDQHAAHERIVYEKLRKGVAGRQPLLIPQIVKMKAEQAAAVLEIKTELADSGLAVESFGDAEIAIYEKPADFDLDWEKCLADVADEFLANGHSSIAKERLHLKLANYACHHSVRAGQKLSLEQMNALLREIENTERGGECNHGRPVWKKFSFDELDNKFER
ncbi:MAG: DNA mismatch repair endonuclease MutL [Rickettsiales bacterium]|jgi:DNA mismatch repair protein MutL|nr:DNA mismatch repair endonuclease MutL [Rickettsiales bacterium]